MQVPIVTTSSIRSILFNQYVLKVFLFIEKIEFNKIASSRNQFSTQLNENEMVYKELELSNADTDVYKLVGPALIKQGRDEAMETVKKRIDFITNQM